MTTQLNPQQEQAANELDGAIKIVAGAGTGKTRVLTQRYINLINSQRATPENILCVTFTNKASSEMLSRIQQTGINISKMDSWILTFHGFGARIIRRHMQEIYPNKRFNIVDTKDSAKIIDEIIYANRIASHLRAKRILNEISRAKDECLSPAEFKLLRSTDLDYTDKELVTEIYILYQKYLEDHGYFDFGDLLCKTIDLFKENPEILEKYQEQLRYIQIDEYQDTNLAQHELIMALGKKHKNVCVVGDPDQTIYTWRGARVQNLANFEEQMGTTKTVTLEQNYRSHQNILDMANSLIGHNVYREEKDLWSETKSGNKVILQASADQASYISRKIDEFTSNGYGYKDICILYRNNNMSGAIETELLRSAIPYDTRDVAFYQRAEIKDSIAYLKVLVDPGDDIQLERIINTPRRSLGKAGITALKEWSRQNSSSLFEALLNLDSIAGLSPKAKKGCQKLITSLEEIWNEHGTDLEKPEKFTAALEGLFEKIEYFEYLKKVDDKERDRSESGGESNRYQNVLALVEICKGADGLEGFLEAVTLDTETNDSSESIEKVSLMTIHRAKGLEYPIVFVTNLSQYLFPRIIDDHDELEEERRLAYVAFTRAEDTLILTWHEDYGPSQFLMEACSESHKTDAYEWSGV